MAPWGLGGWVLQMRGSGFMPCSGAFFPSQRAHPQTKIVLLFPLDKRQQLAEAAAGPYARPGRPAEDVLGAPTCFPAVAPMLRGAGDGVDRREGARAREMKRILVLLLQLDARLQEEGRRGAGGRGGGAKAPQGWQPLYAHLLTHREACGESDPREEQPRKRRRCPRPRP
ncbi:actin-like protein 10 isoform X2 [Cricetulus griseus]|uniref:Actin-like protein 10 isoform X2 n=1 Tax=Cricetulus griseus TaxID=10029 RepID=A0A9J7G563_CRIGR|nr:actin-like protein 10 isoform X2 [Cricetulus griseus]